MQSDNFYGDYPNTMLLVIGKVKSIAQQDNNTVLQFDVTDSPTALGKVSCVLGNNQTVVHGGSTVHILTVAYDAQRENTTDVLLQNCFLLK